MIKRKQILKTSSDFDHAVYFKTPVQVWQNNEFFDYGGVIEKHSETSVRIQGCYYLKRYCEFRVR